MKKHKKPGENEKKTKQPYDTYSKLVLVLFILALLIRFVGINDVMYNDEGSRAFAVRDSGLIGNLVGEGTAQPPMYSWIGLTTTSFIGYSNFTFRITCIILGMLTIYVAFLFARRYFGPKAALWTTAILAFSYYHIVASVQITLDGSMLAFLYLLTLYCFMRYFDDYDSSKKKTAWDFIKNKWLLLTGICLGLALLTKISAILLIPAIALYSLMKTKKIKNAFFDTLISCSIAALMFSVYLLLSLFDKSGIQFLLERAADVAVNSGTNYAALAIQFIQAAIWIGPLLIGLLVISYLSLANPKERDGNTYLLFIFITIILLFYVFIIKDNFRPVERYFMAITAPLSIIAGAYLSKIKFEKKHIYIFAVVFLIFSALLFGLNIKHNEYLSFYPKEAFVQKAIGFDWAIYVPLLGNEGPIGFYMSLDSIIYGFLFTFIALLAYLVLKYSKSRKHIVSAIVVFIAISFSFNALIAEEYLFSAINPNIQKVSADMINYANSDAVNLKKPLFFFRNFALQYYTSEKYGYCTNQQKLWDECSLDFPDENNQKKVDLISKGGTVLVVDFPKINRESLLWKKLNNECKKIKSFYDKNQEIGFIVEC